MTKPVSDPDIDIVERLDKSAKHLFVLSPPDERLLFAEAAAEIRRLRKNVFDALPEQGDIVILLDREMRGQ